MRQYNVIVLILRNETKQNDLFRCTKHPTHLDEMGGGSKTITKRFVAE